MPDKPLPFLDHLDELRQRLIKALLAVVVGAIFSAFFWKLILEWLMEPAGDIELHYFGVLEPFMAKLKLSIFTGVFLASPIVIYEIISFIAPALTQKEKKFTYPFFTMLVLLFFSGVFFGHKFIMPAGTKWLLSQAGGKLVATLSISQYISYAGIFLLGLGVSFETPLVVVLLSKLGVVTPASLLKNWRYALIVIMIVSAILTPDWSPVTMVLFAVPMIALYFLSIFLIKIF